MGGTVIAIQPFEEVSMEGIIPRISTVHNKEGLGNRGASDNINNVCTREEESYGEGKYPVNCTSGISNMDMWVQAVDDRGQGSKLDPYLRMSQGQ
jgi:hypothetical protein